MRNDPLQQGSRRAERMHWWRQVLDRPTQASWDEVFDEMVSLRFQIGEAGSWSSDSAAQAASAGT